VIFSWNNFVFGIVLAGRETRTLPVAVYNMISVRPVELGTAGGRRADRHLPVLLLTVLRQRQIVAGPHRGRRQGR
jgi:multiple sugar transport system permease protein